MAALPEPVAALTERALRAEIVRLQSEYNDGQPFARRKPRRGPPKGSIGPRTEHWMAVIADCVKQPDETMVLTDLGGRTPEQAIAQCRAVARRNRDKLCGLRLAMCIAPSDGHVWAAAVRPGHPAPWSPAARAATAPAAE